MTGSTLEMRLQLKRLCAKHGIAPEPCVVPPSPSTDHAVIVEGYASTGDIDLERTRF
jgi:hypothetical protein